MVLTTHILEVAEKLADRIGIIAEGKLIAEGDLRSCGIAQRVRRRQPGRPVPRHHQDAGRRREERCPAPAPGCSATI